MTDQNQNQLNKLQSEVSDIKTTVETNRLLVDRLDRAIEKMTEVSGHISKLLAVHETRIENQLIREFLNFVMTLIIRWNATTTRL